MANNIKTDLTALSNSSFSLNKIKNRLENLNDDIEILYWKTGNAKLKTCNFDVGCKKIKKIVNSTRTVSEDFEKLERSVRIGGLLLDGLDSLKYSGASFTMKCVYTAADITTYIGRGVQKDIQKIRSSLDLILEDYYSKGYTYKLVQIGKVAIKAGKGIAKIITGVGSIVGTGGLSTPVALLSVVSGVNDVYNSLVDGAYLATEQYDEIGKYNMLRDRMVEGGEMLGELVGNKKAGNIVANTAYYGIDIITSLGTLESKNVFDKNYLNKLKQIKTTDKSKLLGEVKDIANMNISDVSFDKYNLKLMSYAYSETTNFLSNAKLFYSGVKAYTKAAISVNSWYEKVNPDFSNPVVDFFNKIGDVKGKIGNGINKSCVITKFIFD